MLLNIVINESILIIVLDIYKDLVAITIRYLIMFFRTNNCFSDVRSNMEKSMGTNRNTRMGTSAQSTPWREAAIATAALLRDMPKYNVTIYLLLMMSE